VNPALIATIALSGLGLWGLLGSGMQHWLATKALGHPPLAAQASPKPSATPYIAIPVRHGSSASALGGDTSAYAIDVNSATILYQQKATEQRPIASVTKLITAVVILSKHLPSEKVTIHDLPNYQADADLIGLANGETYTVGDLLRAALIASGNDAADQLAIYDSGSVAAFATRMNAKLAEWGVGNANFNNASGLIDTGNFATAETLARVALLALHQPFIKTAVAEQSVTITSDTGRTITRATTDQLLATGNFYGIKTGYTLAAGQCFVGLTKINGHEVVTVVLGSTDRFGETASLAKWISQNYQWY